MPSTTPCIPAPDGTAWSSTDTFTETGPADGVTAERASLGVRTSPDTGESAAEDISTGSDPTIVGAVALVDTVADAAAGSAVSDTEVTTGIDGGDGALPWTASLTGTERCRDPGEG